jgi:hypothetical protein
VRTQKKRQKGKTRTYSKEVTHNGKTCVHAKEASKGNTRAYAKETSKGKTRAYAKEASQNGKTRAYEYECSLKSPIISESTAPWRDAVS